MFENMQCFVSFYFYTMPLNLEFFSLNTSVYFGSVRPFFGTSQFRILQQVCVKQVGSQWVDREPKVGQSSRTCRLV